MPFKPVVKQRGSLFTTTEAIWCNQQNQLRNLNKPNYSKNLPTETNNPHKMPMSNELYDHLCHHLDAVDFRLRIGAGRDSKGPDRQKDRRHQNSFKHSTLSDGKVYLQIVPQGKGRRQIQGEHGYRRLSCNTCVQRKRRPTKNNLGTLEMDYVVGMFIGEHKNLNMYFKPNKKRAA
jgi:hypothetical protein